MATSTSQSEDGQPDVIPIKSTNNDDESSESTECGAELTWTMNAHNNFLQSLSPFTAKHLYSKYTMSVFAVLVVMYEVMMNINNQTFASIWIICSSWFFHIPWMVAGLLSINKEMIPRIAISADFWIKSVTGLLFSIYIGIYEEHQFRHDVPSSLLYGRVLTRAVFCVLFLMFVSAIDGVAGWDRTGRIFLVTAVAASFLSTFIIYEFFKDEYTVTIPNVGTFSIRGYSANSAQVVALFLAKQAGNAFLKGTDQCIAVKYSPFIKWKEPNELNEEKKEENVFGDAYEVESDRVPSSKETDGDFTPNTETEGNVVERVEDSEMMEMEDIACDLVTALDGIEVNVEDESNSGIVHHNEMVF